MELYPWQQRVIDEALGHPKRALFAAPRLGKTLATATQVGDFGNKTLVVAPLSVCGPWKDALELQGIYTYPGYLSSPQSLGKALYGHSWFGAVVINYDKLPNSVQTLQAYRYKGLVFDESHLLKNPQSLRSKAARKLAGKSEFLRILTGTPSPNHYGDLWAQMTLVNPGAWGTSYTQFARRFLIRHAIYPSKIIGYNNLPELQAMIQADADIVRREDVFGPDTYQVVVREVGLGREAQRIYDSLVEDWLYYHERGEILADHTLKRLTRLQQLTSGFLKTETGDEVAIHTKKIDAVMTDLEEIIASGEKAVIFHRFTWEGDSYERSCRDHWPGLQIARLDGSTDANRRGEGVALVRDSKTAAVAIVQTRAGGLGISFAEATHALFVSQSFSFTDEEQARDRIYKPGYNRCITYYRVNQSVDGFIAAVIANKSRIHDAITHSDVRTMSYGRG